MTFARTDTALWHDLIFPNAHAILFLRGRISFCDTDGRALVNTPAPSALIAFGETDAACLRACGLKGVCR